MNMVVIMYMPPWVVWTYNLAFGFSFLLKNIKEVYHGFGTAAPRIYVGYPCPFYHENLLRLRETGREVGIISDKAQH